MIFFSFNPYAAGGKMMQKTGRVGFQKYLRPCALDESSCSLGKVQNERLIRSAPDGECRN